MRSVCEKLFMKRLKANPAAPGTYIQTGKTMVMVESRQWKLAYSPLEKATFDLSDENALLIDVPADRGSHLVPWNMILRITVVEGGEHH
jgi:hypothetical protein